MKVTLKLFASLLAYLPAECRRTSRVDLELVPGATLQELIDRFRLPPGSCALVLVNGAIVPPGDRDGRGRCHGRCHRHRVSRIRLGAAADRY